MTNSNKPSLRDKHTPHFAPVNFSEAAGVRYLHLGSEWVQGAMRLRAPIRLELEYAQQMMAWLLFLDPPAQIVQLGLGAASLTKFCYHYCPASQVTAIELNPAVVLAARAMFELPPNDARLSVIEADAWDFVRDASHYGTIGAMQVDLYDATASGPVLGNTAFYRACRACLTAPAILTVNLFGDHPSFARNMRSLNEAFAGRVIALPSIHDGNRVALAFNGPPLAFDWNALTIHARSIEKKWRLPARAWLSALSEVVDIQHNTFSI
ncbi:MAG: Spermidine synthase [Glomeribacter sp. 1016415]|nr:Spermidine synthase [Glomeribacter sp. 1016415]